jgi:hypothetical protein
MKWSIKRVQALSTSLWVLRAGITGILSVEVRRCSLSSIDVFFTALTHQRKNGIFEEINGCCVYVRHGVSPRSKHRQDARKEEVMEQLQNTASPPASTTPSAWTFREVVDAAIVLGCIPALVLSVIFWAVATAFPTLGGVMSLLVTLLQAVMGMVLIVRYVDITVLNMRAYNQTFSEERIMASVGAGFVCLGLAVSIVVCLSTAGLLEGWHYTLLAAEVLLIGYQTWRVFLGPGH